MALTQVKCGPVKETVRWEATSPMSRLAVTNGVVRQLNCKSFVDSDFAKLSRVTPENQLKEEVAGKLLHEIEKVITFAYNFDERLNVHVMTGDVLIASIEKTNER